jgi:hypothetical protein
MSIWNTSFPGSDFLNTSYPIEIPDLHHTFPQHSAKTSEFSKIFLPLFTHGLMVRWKGWMPELNSIYILGPAVNLTTGQKCYQLPNTPTTLRDMRLLGKPHINSLSHTCHKWILNWSKTTYPQQQINELIKTRNKTQERLETIQGQKEACKILTLKEGSQVWLEEKNLKIKGTWKLMPKQYGPYKIIEQINPVAYHLQLLENMRIHNVFHIDLLSLTRQRKPMGNPTHAHHPSLKKKKKNMRLKLSLICKDTVTQKIDSMFCTFWLFVE